MTSDEGPLALAGVGRDVTVGKLISGAWLDVDATLEGRRACPDRTVTVLDCICDEEEGGRLREGGASLGRLDEDGKLRVEFAGEAGREGRPVRD